MKRELLDYDIYPKVFPCEENVRITIKPLGDHVKFDNSYYKISIQALNQGAIYDYPERENQIDYDIKPDDDGCIRFTHVFEDEQEHFINIIKSGRKIARLSVYSVLPDLVGRYPFMGDLHTHSFRSDGKQSPAIVAANYRKLGYDFIAITDHHRYYPSLEAIYAYKDVPLEYTIIPGEEVHMPKFPEAINDIHIVNFGGTYSINALIENSVHNKEIGTAEKYRSLNGICPETISAHDYYTEVCELQKDLFIPRGIEKFAYASCVWIFNHIRQAGGLGIFCHPFWISDVYQVPQTLTSYITETHPFDAFEVLGGENYFQQNGFQTAHYYDDRARGKKYPIVGSSDSHDSTQINENVTVASTIIFAKDNTREELIDSVKDFFSVAVDRISKEFRLVGETRLIRYACFLLHEFFPLHDELCFEQGRLMKEYVCKNEDAEATLKFIYGSMEKQRKKYFKF